jgi:hypothetical protein
MLFYGFVSENLTAFINEDERAAGDSTFDYEALSHEDAKFARKDTVNEKGFYSFLGRTATCGSAGRATCGPSPSIGSRVDGLRCSSCDEPSVDFPSGRSSRRRH